MIKVVQIIADERDVWGQYDRPEPYFGPASSALLEGFSRLGNEVELHVAACVRKPMPAPGKLAANLFYHPVLVPGGYRRTLFIEAVRRMNVKIREINPDIVHGQGTEDYQGLCAAFSGYRNCITVHGNMREVARKLKYRPFPHMLITALLETLALKKTDAVLCLSSYADRCVGKLNRNKSRIFNAVRPQFFGLKRAPVQTRTLLCIGFIRPYKNQLGLIAALDGLVEKEGLRLIFAGSCFPEEEYSRRFLEAVSTRSWCEYVGRLEPEALHQLMLSCAGVIHPTLEDNLPLAVAEAQASGIPVAASAVGGIPDMIRHGETGLLFNPNDPQDIRQKVEELLNPDLSEKLAEKARAFAETEYHPEAVAKKHVGFYREFLAGKQSVCR